MNILSKWLKSSSRNGARVTGIVLHATAGKSAASSISWLRRTDVMASYHIIIERDGEPTKCVPLERCAWHAGKSFGPQGANVNRYTIGIAFANMNDGEPYTEAQINACAAIISQIKSVYPITWISTHRLVSPGRKTDPKGFKFEEFAKRVGIKPWRPNKGLRFDG